MTSVSPFSCSAASGYAFAAFLGLAVAAAMAGMASADEPGSAASQLPKGSCFATTPAAASGGRVGEIVSLRLRPWNPETDGDGSFPEDEKPDDPSADTLLLTLLGEFVDPRPEHIEWGARFACEPAERDRYSCFVADWCSDVVFGLAVHGEDGLGIDILPDAGSLGPLGDPCSDVGFPLSGPDNQESSFRLYRQPESVCR